MVYKKTNPKTQLALPKGKSSIVYAFIAQSTKNNIKITKRDIIDKCCDSVGQFYAWLKKNKSFKNRVEELLAENDELIIEGMQKNAITLCDAILKSKSYPIEVRERTLRFVLERTHKKFKKDNDALDVNINMPKIQIGFTESATQKEVIIDAD